MHASTKKFFLLSAAAVVIFGAIFISLYSFTAQATVYHLYATTCLGGWENPHLAEGPPDAFAPGELSQFSEKNSARLNGDVHAQIYCGGFRGDILKDTAPTKILVMFSASTAEAESVELEELPTAPEVPEVQETEEVLEIEQTPEETPSVEEPTSVPESALEEQPVSLLRLFMPRAQAQEIEAEETVEADAGLWLNLKRRPKAL